MSKSNQQVVIADEIIISKIYYIRGQKVMIDKDLAELYNVTTGRLNEQVKRNIDRFPEDFSFQLSEQEFENLKSQFAISSWGGRRTPPFAFTEHGVLMLSGVLNSEIAIKTNIQIIRIFTKMREMLLTHKDILLKLEVMEKTLTSHDKNIETIFHYLKQLLSPPNLPRKKIGFKNYE